MIRTARNNKACPRCGRRRHMTHFGRDLRGRDTWGCAYCIKRLADELRDPLSEEQARVAAKMVEKAFER